MSGQRKSLNLDPTMFVEPPKSEAMSELFGNIDSSKVTQINLEDIVDFHNHAFKVEHDEQMQDLIESIRELGIQQPLLLWLPNDSDKYECVSGHRRKYAAKCVGLTSVPAIILNCDKETAEIIMVDSNNQREEISISEKAKAYKIKNDAIKKKPEFSFESFGRTRDIIAKDSKDSAAKIARYIKIAVLPEVFLNYLDEKKLTLMAAINLVSLKDEQLDMVNIYCEDGIFPSEEQAKEIRDLAESDELTNDAIKDILNINGSSEYEDPIDKANRKEVARMKKFTAATKSIWPKDIDNYIPLGDREELLKELVMKWYNEKRMEAEEV